jgi:thiol-disulfide isomerase/thioredoxin
MTTLGLAMKLRCAIFRGPQEPPRQTLKWQVRRADTAVSSASFTTGARATFVRVDEMQAYPSSEPSRAELEQLPGPVVVEFGANWCGICQAAQPAIAQAVVELASD